MLELLRIRNLALIEDMELEFSSGLNVLTGETGAGKSFILKAINFLTGDKLSPDMVRGGADKAVVEALFALPDGDLVLRRELVAETGRSRAYANDQLTSQDNVRELRPRLFIHAGQHGQQRLLQPGFQREILDGFMNRPDLVTARDRDLAALRHLANRRETMEARFKELADRREMLEFQQAEIDKVSPQPGEEESLEATRAEMKNLGKLREAADGALTCLLTQEVGLVEQLSTLERYLAALADHLPDYAEYGEAVENFQIQLRELSSQLRGQRLGEADGESMDSIDARLFALSQLKRKLRRTLPEILDLRREIEDNLSFLDACALDLKQLKREEAGLVQALNASLEALNAARREAAAKLSAALETILRNLGFTQEIRVEFEFTPHTLYEADGPPPCQEDLPRLLWLPNPGQPAQPLDKIASGGELSRFLLAVISLMADENVPSLIFDEVDAGIGGLTLNQVAAQLHTLAHAHQVLVITHWPQLAAHARRHFVVSKEIVDSNTQTLCRALPTAEIPLELARMAGGGAQGEALARELLSQ